MARLARYLEAVYHRPHEKSVTPATAANQAQACCTAQRGNSASICSARFVVGDRYGDVELAFSAGAKGIFVKTGYGLGDFTWHSKNLAQAGRLDYR